MNTSTLGGPVVAKPKAKMGRPPSGRDEATVRIDRDLARKLRFLASENRMAVGHYLSNQVRAQIERAYEQAVKDL